MAKVAIIFQSSEGHTRELAKAIACGVGFNPKHECVVIDVEAPPKDLWDIIAHADALIFGSPTYMGTVSAPFKAFMDKSGELWLKQPWKNKIAAGFTISTSYSGDKFGTLSALMVFAMQHGMIWVGQDHIGSIYTKDGEELNDVGSWLGLMGRSNPDKSKMIFEGDKKTAHRFGERVALVAENLKIRQ